MTYLFSTTDEDIAHIEFMGYGNKIDYETKDIIDDPGYEAISTGNYLIKSGEKEGTAVLTIKAGNVKKNITVHVAETKTREEDKEKLAQYYYSNGQVSSIKEGRKLASSILGH